MSEPEGRAIEGLVHLQGAALELLAAARAFLDVADSLVRDPAAAGAIVETLSAVASMARTSEGRAGPARPADGARDRAPEAARVRRIPLSDEG